MADRPTAAPLTDDPVTLESIRAAAQLIAPYVVHTPTLPLGRLSEAVGVPVVAKLEMLQHTGAFKARGAFHRMLRLSDDERAAGVVAVSGGNHGLAVAYAARHLGIAATVIMPATTAATSVQRARADGAHVLLTDTIGEAFADGLHAVGEGRVMIHPFDDNAVIAGQGTVGLELLADAPDVTDVFVSIGGGGLITGVATAVRSLRPETRIWGVETYGAETMSTALAAGEPVTLPVISSIATTLGAPVVSARTLAGVQSMVEEVVLVSDEDAVRGIETLAQVAKVVTEPAASCTWAAALQLRDRLPPDARVALVLCGGNVSLDDIAGWRKRFSLS